MKKEVFLAITIGFALGLIITFGIWTANRSLKNAKMKVTPEPTPSEEITASPTPTSQPTSKLTITSPLDESLVSTGSVVLTGTTDPKSIVAITYENDKQQIVVADDTGNFTATIDLVAGYNTINVTSVDKDGKQTTKSIIVTFSTAKI